MAYGWIKLHRKITECFIWNDKPFDKARAWIDLLLMASHEDHKTISGNKAVVIEQGSFVTSAYKLADRWGWNRKTVMDYLKLLESENMVATERTTKGTTVTIVNYGKYQLDGTTERTTQRTAERTTERTTQGLHDNIYNNTNINHLTRMDKNGKEYKENKESSLHSDSLQKKVAPKVDLEDLFRINNIQDGLKETVENWIAYKAERGFKYKERGLKSLLSQISKYRMSYGESAVIDAIEMSISNGYQGIVWDRIAKGGAKSGRTGADDRAVEEDPYAKRFRDAARGCLSDMSEHGVENLFD